MLFFDGAFGLIWLGLWLFCLIDVITTPEERCRNLPKVAWVLIVLLFMDIGSIVWLVAGRTWEPRAQMPGVQPPRVQRPRPMATPRTTRPGNPDDDEEFLAGLRARAEEQRRRAREAEQRDEQDPGPVS